MQKAVLFSEVSAGTSVKSWTPSADCTLVGAIVSANAQVMVSLDPLDWSSRPEGSGGVFDDTVIAYFDNLGGVTVVQVQLLFPLLEGRKVFVAANTTFWLMLAVMIP